MDIIKLEKVTFRYDEERREILHGIDLSVRQGEFLCILGHNGCGKSTLAKLMNGLLVPETGTVTVKGMDTADEENLLKIRSCAGMVFQNPDNQMVATVVEEDVAFGPENLGVEQGQLRKRVDEALKTVNMSEFALSSPNRLSGGQKQRIAIAGVLAMEPEILILDEATAMLDPKGRREILETARRLNKEKNMTVIFITHFMEETVDADRILVMNDGRIALEGTPQEVFMHEKELQDMTLTLPPVTCLAKALQSNGIPIPQNILHEEELTEAIWQFLSKN